MNKKTNIVFLIILIIIMTTMLIQIPTISHAKDIDSIITKGRSFISRGGTGGINQTEIENTFIPVGQTLVIIGDAVLFVVTGIMGINYIMASPDKKAKLKQQLIGLVVSIVVIHGAVVIWETAKNFMANF